jgi:hypothetical protein
MDVINLLHKDRLAENRKHILLLLPETLMASLWKTGSRLLATIVMKRAGESLEIWNLADIDLGAKPRKHWGAPGRSETFRTSGGGAAKERKHAARTG